MDDFNVSSLHESKNEWGARLLTILTPFIVEGFKSIFDESNKLCKENGEKEKYLMTFQNFIARIPKWNATIIENEKNRIVEKSGCSYLEELVTCIHIIQLKLLTAMRVGQKQKKIDINIPKLEDFIHKCYINVARKVYKNVYLFEINCAPLQIQRNSRELETIVQECILNAVRESIPVESILKAYMSTTEEEEETVEIKEQIIPKKIEEPVVHIAEREIQKEKEEPIFLLNEKEKEKEITVEDKGLVFNDVDIVVNNDGEHIPVEAPKSIDRLEEISAIKNLQRKMEEEMENDKLKIIDEDVILNDIQDINDPSLMLEDIEVLE